jgi:prevent-host-death family protein
MATIRASDANLDELLRRVRAGEEIILTEGGRAVARLSPASAERDQERIRRSIDDMRALSRGLSLGGLKIKDLVNAGRP